MRKTNAHSKLGNALTRCLESTPARTDRGNLPHQRNVPVVSKKHKPCPNRKQWYLEDYSAQSTNCVRSRIVNADGSCIAVDVFNHSSAQARRSYRKRERR